MYVIDICDLLHGCAQHCFVIVPVILVYRNRAVCNSRPLSRWL